MHPALREYALSDGRRIRHFSDERIQQAVEEAMAIAEAKDKPVAAVAHFTNEGWKVSAVARLGDKLSVMAAMYDDYQFEGIEDLDFEAKVVWTP